MTGERKVASDGGKFYDNYIKKRTIKSKEEESFLLGYYAHLITDAEFQRYIRDTKRVASVWDRINNHILLKDKASGMEKTWDSVKQLISVKERMKDIYFIEKEYLDEHPDSGYLTEIISVDTFPDYIDYLPKGAITRKVGVMGYLPKKVKGEYSFIAMTREEYNIFINQATELVIDALKPVRL